MATEIADQTTSHSTAFCRTQPASNHTEYLRHLYLQDRVHAELTHLVKSLLDRDLTVLVFLPGKTEIMQVLHALEKVGVESKSIVPLHGDLEYDEIQRAKKPTSFSRAVLATSKAETSITLSDVDAVIDLGISRSIEHGDDLLLVQDFAAPAAILTQRLGRVC
jgi:HrpA-like RNA helicase